MEVKVSHELPNHCLTHLACCHRSGTIIDALEAVIGFCTRTVLQVYFIDGGR